MAFDVLYRLLGVGGGAGLLQQFAYMQLADAIDALVNAVSMELDASQIHRECGYRRNASI